MRPKHIGRYKVKQTTEDRFWEKVEEGALPEFAPRLGNCWLWTGSKQRRGYGYFSIHSETTKTGWRRCLAHRFAYELLVAPIPEGLFLDHLCRVPSCVRPDHLEPVTHTENLRRGMSGGLKTHCKNGHEFTPDNTYLAPGTGYRSCVICRVESKRRRRHKS